MLITIGVGGLLFMIMAYLIVNHIKKMFEEDKEEKKEQEYRRRTKKLEKKKKKTRFCKDCSRLLIQRITYHTGQYELGIGIMGIRRKFFCLIDMSSVSEKHTCPEFDFGNPKEITEPWDGKRK